MFFYKHMKIRDQGATLWNTS